MKKRIRSFTLIDVYYNKKSKGHTNWPLLLMFFFSSLILSAIIK